MILYFIIFYICTYTTAAVLPANSSIELMDDKEMYSSKPSEILPIQPVLVYPPPDKQVRNKARNLLKDNEIIYIKLLKRKSYRPKMKKKQIEEKISPKDIQMKDIFYVKALANGQFSHNRLKLYRLPEFYAITVYKNGNLKDK